MSDRDATPMLSAFDFTQEPLPALILDPCPYPVRSVCEPGLSVFDEQALLGP